MNKLNIDMKLVVYIAILVIFIILLVNYTIKENYTEEKHPSLIVNPYTFPYNTESCIVKVNRDDLAEVLPPNNQSLFRNLREPDHRYPV